jgi:hypothetical protein
MKTTDYKFRTRSWPPPEDRQHKDCYLLGFDEDNQPYVLRYEKRAEQKGWVAVTLDDYSERGISAALGLQRGKIINKLITSWVDMPLLKRVLRKEAA